MPISVENQLFPSLLADFRQILLETQDWHFGGWGGFEFLIRKRFNFPEPFRLVRKTLLISFLLISEDLIRQKLSYELGGPENLTFGPNSGGRFSGGLLDFQEPNFWLS